MTVGPMKLAPVGAVTGPGDEFFDRARQRLTLEVPARRGRGAPPAPRG